MATKKEKLLMSDYRKAAIEHAKACHQATIAKAKMVAIEKFFLEKVKEKGSLVIDGSVLTLMTKQSTTCSYSAIYKKAIEIVDDKIALQLITYKDSISKNNVHESLNVVDAVIIQETKALKFEQI